MDVREQIKARVSITEVASLYVDLKPAGKNLKALCPFHTEKTASFFVIPEKESFTCYGCHKFGDIFTLVQEMEGLTFAEAMNFLIERFHIPVDRAKNKPSTPTSVYAEINDITLRYFRDTLLNSPEGKKAYSYLIQRGISRETIDKFCLGYSENKWDGLYNHLKRKGSDLEKAAELGLLVRHEQKNSLYDRFRGRIMIPIYSESGTLIAFGGRTIVDDTSKYLNSPDTPLYKKSNHLFGFNLAKNAIREKKSSILVEGYFDMISLYQHGIQNVAASLGTALTDSQVYLLKRFSDSVYIYYDSDNAGITATLRAIEKMFEQNINPAVISTTAAKDPDDFIKQKGLKAFNELLNQSTDGVKFLVGQAVKKFDIRIPEKKSQAVDSVMTVIEKFGDAIIKNEYTRMVADYFTVDEKMIRSTAKKSPAATETPSTAALLITPAERIFLQCIFSLPEFIGDVKPLFNEKLFSILPSRNIIRLLFNYYNPQTRSINDFGQMLEKLNTAERAEIRNMYEKKDNLGKNRNELEPKIESAIVEFWDMLNKNELKSITRQIKVAEKENNKELIFKLMGEKERYIREKHKKSNTGGAVEIL